MAIVRPDRRALAVADLATLRELTTATLVQTDAIRAGLEGLELKLGLAQESEIDAREQYLVLHCAANDPQGHELGECMERGCQAAMPDPALTLAEGEEGAEREGEGEDPP
jgi:hypothetical protein